MDFAQILQRLMEFLTGNLIDPINAFLDGQAHQILSLTEFQITFGLGEITWFSLTLYDLLLIVIGLMVSITALILTWRFLKFLNGFVKGLFTGIKK